MRTVCCHSSPCFVIHGRTLCAQLPVRSMRCCSFSKEGSDPCTPRCAAGCRGKGGIGGARCALHFAIFAVVRHCTSLVTLYIACMLETGHLMELTWNTTASGSFSSSSSPSPSSRPLPLTLSLSLSLSHILCPSLLVCPTMGIGWDRYHLSSRSITPTRTTSLAALKQFCRQQLRSSKANVASPCQTEHGLIVLVLFWGPFGYVSSQSKHKWFGTPAQSTTMTPSQ